jgi:D-alanyl-D-alanine carboxypeptidase/D-alanyl-D-alanine-endopeptidase (penicillin-binding protein 4)
VKRLALVALTAALLGAYPGTVSEEVPQLASEIQRLIDANRWPSARWSVLAVSLDTGDTLFARDPDLLLAPASNVKILTTAAALHHLGPDFRFRTFLLADGNIRDGVLEGDLVLYGTGDPAISDRFFGTREAVLERLVMQLQEAGITRVTGDIVGDASLLPGPWLASAWDPEDLNDWFAAPISALSFNENVVTLRVEAAGDVGRAPVVHTIPDGAELPIANHAVTVAGRSRTGLAILRETPRDSLAVEGELRVGAADVWRRMTVSDPPAFAASVLRSTLMTAGIGVDGGSRGAVGPGRSLLPQDPLWAPAIRPGPHPRILAVHDSPRLEELLAVVNKESHNLYAELILKTLGRVVAGDGTFTGGAGVVESFLAQEVGVSPDHVHLEDGSGLSATNRASAGVFIAVLEYMAQSPHWESFWFTLPEAGNPRELRRMYRTRAARNLRAKTGTIDRVSALSGLVRSANGERLLFSILANDVPSTSAAKRIEDRIGGRLADFSRPFQPLPDRTEVAGAGSGVPELRAQPLRHRVRSGENLSVIARRYGVLLEDLIRANPGTDRRALQVGEVLDIPR